MIKATGTCTLHVPSCIKTHIKHIVLDVPRKEGLSGKELSKCTICFSISFQWYAFLSFCMQICRPFACGLCISSKASVTVNCVNFVPVV